MAQTQRHLGDDVVRYGYSGAMLARESRHANVVQ